MKTTNKQYEKILISEYDLVFVTHPSKNTSVIIASKKEDSILESTPTNKLLDDLYSFVSKKDYTNINFRTLKDDENLIIKSNVDQECYLVETVQDNFKITNKLSQSQNLDTQTNNQEQNDILGQ